jgi:hypothetical protein
MNFYHRHRGASIAECAESSMIAMSQLARIDVPVQRLSSLTPPDGHWGGKADMVLSACRAVGADTYLSGLSGATYLEPHESKFARAGVKIEVQSYPVAVEVPGLSSLHTYLLHGEERLRELVRHT